MANSLKTRQWLIDTPGASVLWDGEIKIEQIEFTDYNLDTDNFVVTDSRDDVVYRGNGAADLSPIRTGKIGWVHGLKVPTLSAGKLLVYIH